MKHVLVALCDVDERAVAKDGYDLSLLNPRAHLDCVLVLCGQIGGADVSVF